VGALRLYDEILKTDPKNPEALSYRGWIVHLAGLTDEGLGYVNRAIDSDPTYAFAHFFKGLMLLQGKSDPGGAVPELEAFLANDPPSEMVAPAEGILQSARDAAAGRPSSPTTAPPAG
jgi:tetratricopeptide (TPR) repeat protein